MALAALSSIGNRLNDFSYRFRQYSRLEAVTSLAVLGVGAGVATCRYLSPISSAQRPDPASNPGFIFVNCVALTVLFKVVWDRSHFLKFFAVQALAVKQIGIRIGGGEIDPSAVFEAYPPRDQGSKELLPITLGIEKVYGTTFPVLTYTSTDPYQMGYAEGYVLANQILEVKSLVLEPMMRYVAIKMDDPHFEQLKAKAPGYNLTAEMEVQLKGMRKGIMDWAEEHGRTLDAGELDKYLMWQHCFPEVYKIFSTRSIFRSSLFKFLFSAFEDGGCSTLLLKEGNRLMVARNLDWPSVGRAGTFLVMKQYDYAGAKIVSFGIPGMVGVTTGFKYIGDRLAFAVIINAVGIVSHNKGLPFNVLAREILHKASSVEEALALLHDQSEPDDKAASSHHLILVDGKRGVDIQFYPPDSNRYFLMRELDEALITTNHYVKGGKMLTPHPEHSPTTLPRFEAVQNVLEQPRQGKDLLTIGIEALEKTNSASTLLSLVADMSTGQMYCTYSNAWAAQELRRTQ